MPIHNIYLTLQFMAQNDSKWKQYIVEIIYETFEPEGTSQNAGPQTMQCRIGNCVERTVKEGTAM